MSLSSNFVSLLFDIMRFEQNKLYGQGKSIQLARNAKLRPLTVRLSQNFTYAEQNKRSIVYLCKNNVAMTIRFRHCSSPLISTKASFSDSVIHKRL